MAIEQCKAASSLLRVLVLIYKGSVLVRRRVDEGQCSCWLLVRNKRRHGALHVGSHDNTLSFISVPNFRTVERLLLLLVLHS